MNFKISSFRAKAQLVLHSIWRSIYNKRNNLSEHVQGIRNVPTHEHKRR